MCSRASSAVESATTKTGSRATKTPSKVCPPVVGRMRWEKKNRFGCMSKVKHHMKKWRRAVIGFLCLTFVVLVIGFAIFLGDSVTTEFSLKMDHPSLCFLTTENSAINKERVLAKNAKQFLEDRIANKKRVVEKGEVQHDAYVCDRAQQTSAHNASQSTNDSGRASKSSEESRLDEQVLDVIIKSVALESKVSFLQPTKMLLHHSCVVIRTTNWWWSVEREDGYILIQRNKERNMVHNCRFGKPRPSNFFGLSGPHQVKKVAVMDMYQNLDIANYFEKVLLRAEGEQHKATQRREVYEPYNLLERNCQHLAENTYRFFRSGSIEEDKCTRWLARIIVPIYTAVFLSLIVVGPTHGVLLDSQSQSCSRHVRCS